MPATKFLDSSGLSTLWANCKSYFAKKAHQQAGSTIYDLTDVIYPVGSIYISTSSTSPATLFGGTWEELKGRFLLGRDTGYAAGSTGGEAEHTLVLSETPSHKHSVSVTSSGAHNHTLTAVSTTSGTSHDYGLLESWLKWTSTRSVTVPENSTTNGAHTHTVSETSKGGGGAHNNMPPYLAVYMWKRLTLAGNQPIEPDPASPNSISAGTSAPSGGINGDIYIQY